MNKDLIEELLDWFQDSDDDFQEVLYYVSEEFSLDIVSYCRGGDHYELTEFMSSSCYGGGGYCEECIEHIFG